MFTSCCPAWIRFAENEYPEFLENISTCRSPMEMFASTIKESYEGDKKHVHVAIMPCTAKKYEAKRDEFKDKDGNSYVDYVLTTQEVIGMIKTAGIDFANLEETALDDPYAMITGSGVLFGVTGGVTESVLRYVMSASSEDAIQKIAFTGVRGLEGVKEAVVTIGDKELKFAIASGLANARALIEKVKSGEAYYDLIEVMTCPGGCINGAGQPVADLKERIERSKGIYNSDVATEKKEANQNVIVKELLAGKLKGREHELLHVHYKKH
jgi:NADH-quinone oxidoreductase subunit G